MAVTCIPFMLLGRSWRFHCSHKAGKTGSMPVSSTKYKYYMLINEILNELTFAGSRCTKDCSGHKAGYRWALRKGATSANSKSPSFNNGAAIAGNQQQSGLIRAPKVRDERGRFYFNPR